MLHLSGQPAASCRRHARSSGENKSLAASDWFETMRRRCDPTPCDTWIWLPPHYRRNPDIEALASAMCRHKPKGIGRWSPRCCRPIAGHSDLGRKGEYMDLFCT